MDHGLLPDPNGTCRCEEVFATFAEEDIWSPRTAGSAGGRPGGYPQHKIDPPRKCHRERPTNSWDLETILQCMDLDVFWLDRPEMQEQVSTTCGSGYIKWEILTIGKFCNQVRENLLEMGNIALVDRPREKEPMISCTFINDDDRPCKFQPVITDRHGGSECPFRCWKIFTHNKVWTQ